MQIAKHTTKQTLYEQWVKVHNKPNINLYCRSTFHYDNVYSFDNYLFCGVNRNISDIIFDDWDWYKPYCIAITDKYTNSIIINLSTGHNIKQLGLVAIDTFDNVFITTKLFDTPNMFTNTHSSTGRLNKVLKLYGEYLVTQFIKTDCFDLCVASKQQHNVHKAITDVFSCNDDNCGNPIDFWKKNPRVTYDNIFEFVNRYNVTNRPFYDDTVQEPIVLSNKDKRINSTVYRPTLKHIIENNMFSQQELDNIKRNELYYRYCKNTGISYKELCDAYNAQGFDKALFNSSCRKHKVKITASTRALIVTQLDGLLYIAKQIKEKLATCIEQCINKSKENYEKAIIELNTKVASATEEDKQNHKTIVVKYKEYIKQKDSKGFWSESIITKKL